VRQATKVQKFLTPGESGVTIKWFPGGMAEWFKAAVLKTVAPGNGGRGFKSYSLRQEISQPEISRLAYPY
jgi:hypothetical protein